MCKSLVFVVAEIPSITVSGEADENETGAEGSSGECMGPPSVAGTSSEGAQVEQVEEMLEGDDGVKFTNFLVPYLFESNSSHFFLF